jgi:hypothetical protein
MNPNLNHRGYSIVVMEMLEKSFLFNDVQNILGTASVGLTNMVDSL